MSPCQLDIPLIINAEADEQAAEAGVSTSVLQSSDNDDRWPHLGGARMIHT
jgi:hypothetical protein